MFRFFAGILLLLALSLGALAQDQEGMHEVELNTILTKAPELSRRHYIAHVIPVLKNGQKWGGFFTARAFNTKRSLRVDQVDIHFLDGSWASFVNTEMARRYYKRLHRLEKPRGKRLPRGSVAIMVEVNGKLRFHPIAPADKEGVRQVRNLLQYGQEVFYSEWRAFRRILRTGKFQRERISPANDPLGPTLQKICEAFSMQFQEELISRQR
jgi:hypothetical protein